jgi:aminoglycoside phosphotransferase (APT) family kinase protein
MSVPVYPYLSVLRTQLATSLMPRDDEGKKTAIYAHRTLTHLLLQLDTLPVLQQKTLGQYAGLLDELIGELSPIDGGMILTPWLIRHVRAKPDYVQAEPFLQNAVRLLTSAPTANGARLLRTIAAIALELQDALKEAVRSHEIKSSGAEIAADPLSDSQKLAFRGYLRDKFPDETALDVGTAKAIVGGGSKQTLFVELHNTRRLPRTIVVRLDRSDGVGRKSVVNEFVLLEAVYQAGLLVPQPFGVEPDASLLGAPFMVTSLMEGHTLGDWTEISEPSRAFAVGLARTLAKLHRIPPERLGDVIVGANMTTRERMRQDIAKFENSWRTLGQPSIALELAYAWLREQMEFADGERAIIHCELGTPNMLGKDGELTAVLDWEEAVIGNPAQDLTYVRPAVVQMMPWEEFLAEYEKAGGVIPTVGEMDFYRLWREVFGMHFLLMARSFFVSEMSSSTVLGYVSQHVYHRYEYDLHETVKMLYDRYR